MATSSTAAPAPRAAFGAWSSALASYRLVFAHPVDIVRIGWVWVVLAHLIGYVLGYLAVHVGFAYLSVLSALAMTLCAAAFAVKWHRRALLGMAAVGPLLALAGRDFRFVGRAILLLLVTIIPLVVLMFLAVLAMFSDVPVMIAITLLACFAAFLFAMYVLIRFSLILPAAAIDDDKTGWRESWAATAGVSVRLWGGALAATLPLAIFSKLIENLAFYVMFQFNMLPLALVFGALSTIVVFLTVAVAASYTSLAYRALVGR
jgi:hypothetical protein